VYPCNSSTQEAEVGGLKFQGQPELHRETLVPPSHPLPAQKEKKEGNKTKNDVTINKLKIRAICWWLMLITLATQEADMSRLVV
jgi:hypothetical protein